MFQCLKSKHWIWYNELLSVFDLILIFCVFFKFIFIYSIDDLHWTSTQYVKCMTPIILKFKPELIHSTMSSCSGLQNRIVINGVTSVDEIGVVWESVWLIHTTFPILFVDLNEICHIGCYLNQTTTIHDMTVLNDSLIWYPNVHLNQFEIGEWSIYNSII